MDIGMRVMQQINVSTSLSLVRFLGSNLDSMLSALDMCVASVLVLLLSYLVGSEHVLSTLSRRLAILMILEKLKPLIVTVSSGDNIIHIRGKSCHNGNDAGDEADRAIRSRAWKQRHTRRDICL